MTDKLSIAKTSPESPLETKFSVHPTAEIYTSEQSAFIFSYSEFLEITNAPNNNGTTSSLTGATSLAARKFIPGNLPENVKRFEEAFKKRVDEAFNYQNEFYYYKLSSEELNHLKLAFKHAIPRWKKYYDDVYINNTEWKQIYASLNGQIKKLLNKLDVSNGASLGLIIGEIPANLSPLTEYQIKKMTEACISDYSDSFYNETLPNLNQRDAGEILFRLAKAGQLGGYLHYSYLETFERSPYFRQILLLAASTGETGPIFAFSQFSLISNYSWAHEVLVEAAKYLSFRKVDEILNDTRSSAFVNLSKQQKQAILIAARNSQANLPIFTAVTRQNLKPNLDNIKRDVALSGASSINPQWIQASLGSRKISSRQMAHFQVLVARNLFFQEKPINETTVRAEIQRIRSHQNTYQDVGLFKGRNVLLAANNEIMNDKYRFGKTKTVAQINRSGGKLTRIRPYPSKRSLQLEKQAILEKIRTTPPPFTFFFDGHGSENRIYLSDGQIEGIGVRETQETISISVEEVAEALKEREKNFPELKTAAPDKKDIFIIASCYSQNFMRSLYDRLGQNAALPIGVVMSEYGQYGFSDLSSGFGSQFMEGISKRNSTLNSLFAGDKWFRHSNPAVYITDSNNRIMQLS